MPSLLIARTVLPLVIACGCMTPPAIGGEQTLTSATSHDAKAETAVEPADPLTTSGALLAAPPEAADSLLTGEELGDRVYLVSTRHLPTELCCAPLGEIPFRIWRVHCGRAYPLDLATYRAQLGQGRTVVVYVHGNRMPAAEIRRRAHRIRAKIAPRTQAQGLDWVIFSWPSQQTSIGLSDFREKADRCDAQGLYLAALLHPQIQAATPVTMIGYSFGARVITGALHTLAGGALRGRSLPQPPVIGGHVGVGLVAPAIESTWLGPGGYHGRAVKNIAQLVLLYNRRDAVLKRYWLIEKVRRETALGFSGPTCFARRADGSRLPVRSRDCSPSVRLRHAELDYYNQRCRAGSDLARLIDAIAPTASP